MKSLFQLILFLCFGILLRVNSAIAFQLKPISQVFAPIGAEATQSYEIINDTEERIAVEVTVVEREMNLDGEESYSPAEDDFLVYPSQIILPPDAVQVVRVSWLGDPEPDQEMTFRLKAEQLPINLVDPNAPTPTRAVGEVKVMLRYLGSLYIRPAEATPEVILESAIAQSGANGEPELAITFHNQGTASAKLKDLKLTLTAQGKTVRLSSEQLEGMTGRTVLPHHRRRFTLPFPSELPKGEINASFEYDQG